ncbi:MAG: hypothetical protein LBU09_00120 [Endomicrobium sp.]|jgi:murein DD-endopeptidase MepM/ murein hydrolase activator NlpD|nr:hypothetical protein [Endomicrobium sp.]
MEIILGKPSTRGKSDVVDNFGTSAAIDAGLVVKRTGEDTVAAFDGSGVPFGISGYTEVKGQKRIAVNKEGLGIGVLLATPNESITVGAPVYATAAGKVTATATNNTALNATFASVAGDAIDVIKNTKVAGGGVRIDIGGL